MIHLLLFTLLLSDMPKVTKYGISLHQKRTLFAVNEMAPIWVRVGNNSPRELKVKYLPNVMDSLKVTKAGVELKKNKKYQKIDLYRNMSELRVNGHKDLGVDLTRLFPEMKQGGIFEVAYQSEHFNLTGKNVRISTEKLPNLDAVYLLKTSMGDIGIKLIKEEAPNHVRNFAILSAEGFYKDMIFHRVVRGFVIQTGDPRGDGSGGSGFSLDMEWSPFVKHNKYMVGMARATERDSADSQFYICLEETRKLNKDYTVFGKVVSGMDVVDKIGVVGTTGPYGNPPNKPFDDVALYSVEIVEP
ncbi:MAG: hypothetical protein CR997_12030 [Acidobacteria bacterium]|nr:MAG: hypothetical protein CR997_12030 [Acidobacteriota bacterium]